MDLQEHVNSVAKVTAGGAGATGTVWVSIVAFLHKIADMPLDHATQIANLCGACAAAIYYLVATILAIKGKSKDATAK